MSSPSSPAAARRPRAARRTALVTGGSGFIAGPLIAALVERGWQVRTCGRRPRPGTLPAEVDYQQVDLAGDEPLESLVAGISRVFHLAGLSSSQAGEQEMRRANVAGTENLLAAAHAEGVQRVLHMSTSSIYGKDVQLPQPVPEDVEPHPSPGYAETKWQGEQVAWGFADKGLPVTVVRPVTVYGPGNIKLLGSTILDAAIERHAGLEAFAVPAEPVELRMVHLDDVVTACIHLAEHDQAAGRAYNIASDVYPDSHEVGAIVAERLGLALEPTDDPDRGLSYEQRSEVRDRMLAAGMRDDIYLKEERIRFLKKANPNNRLSLRELRDSGFEPQVTDITQSIPATIRWYEEQRWIL